MSKKQFTVEVAASRLDVWLSENLDGVSRSRARQLCEAGEVFINGRPARAGAFLNQGSVVEVRSSIEPAAARILEAEQRQRDPKAKLELAFEDEFFLVVKKPRGMATVTLRNQDPITLADILVTYASEQSGNTGVVQSLSPDPREAGLVQRLDFWTSGLLLASKSRAIWERLRRELFDGKIEKTYLALVEGRPETDSFVIESPLVAAVDGKTMQLADRKNPKAMTARTEAEVLDVVTEKDKAFTLLRVNAERARRHQVRVHLSSYGIPLVGDLLYGAKCSLDHVPVGIQELVPPPLEGFLLHAESLRFKHPVSGVEKQFRDFPLWAEICGKL